MRCHSFRGPTDCDQGKCICKAGFCAKDLGTGHGICQLDTGHGPYIARVKPVSQQQPRFPPPHDGVDTGLAVSGGGWRALTFGVGVLKAMHQLGLMQHVDAISSVSGGTWAAAVYMFANRSADELFGPARRPRDLSLSAANGHPGALGRLATVGVRPWLSHLSLRMRSEDLWPSFVSETFLEPFGLGDRTAFMASSWQDVTRIRRENPGLRSVRFLVPTPGRPKVFIMGGIIGPPVGYRLDATNVVFLSMSPDYTGSPFHPNGSAVTYHPVDANDLGPLRTWIGGGLVETFAFGGSRPTDGRSAELGGDRARLPPPAQPFSLAEAVAVSSTAPLNAFSNMPIALGLSLLMPRLLSWPIGPGAGHAQRGALLHKLGDGGNVENSGLLALLQRGARRAVMVDSQEVPLTLDVDFCSAAPAQRYSVPWLAGKVGLNLASLFGYGLFSDYVYYTNNQVFPSDAWSSTLCGMQSLKRSGKPIVYRSNLTVLPNSWWGIAGNYTLDLVIVYLDKSSEYESKLPGETRASLPADFPYLPSAPLPYLAFSNREVNLLEGQAEYTIRENEAQLRQLLARP